MKQLIPPSSGSVAGTTYARNRFGQYIRSRSTPTNPATAKQVARRATVTAAAATWKTLTEAARLTWKSWAENHPKLDSLGQTIWLTGFQWFVSAFSNSATVGMAVPVSAPEEPVFDPAAVTGITSIAGAITVASIDPLPNEFILVRMSFPRSAGVGFEKDFRLVKVLSESITSPTNVASDYAAVFGAPAEGQKIFARCNEVKSGIMGPDMNFDFIFNAA